VCWDIVCYRWYYYLESRFCFHSSKFLVSLEFRFDQCITKYHSQWRGWIHHINRYYCVVYALGCIDVCRCARKCRSKMWALVFSALVLLVLYVVAPDLRLSLLTIVQCWYSIRLGLYIPALLSSQFSKDPVIIINIHFILKSLQPNLHHRHHSDTASVITTACYCLFNTKR